MNSWDRIRDHVARKLRPIKTRDNELELLCRFESTRQSLTVRRVDGGADPAIEVLAPIGNEQEYSQRAALVYNSSAKLGALVLDGNQMVLRSVMPLAAVNENM